MDQEPSTHPKARLRPFDQHQREVELLGGAASWAMRSDRIVCTLLFPPCNPLNSSSHGDAPELGCVFRPLAIGKFVALAVRSFRGQCTFVPRDGAHYGPLISCYRTCRKWWWVWVNCDRYLNGIV